MMFTHTKINVILLLLLLPNSLVLQAKIEMDKHLENLKHPSQDSSFSKIEHGEEENHAWSDDDFIEISNKPPPPPSKKKRGRKNKSQAAKKNGKSRGGYLTLTEELRNKLHRILHEQVIGTFGSIFLNSDLGSNLV